MSNFKTWAESSTFSKHALFIFDACFAGSIFSSRGAPTTNEVINYNTTNPVRQFIASGSANETVPDESVFCTQFVYALSSNDADFNKDGYLTATELGEYLKNTVIQYRKNRQHPQYGKLDNPNFDKGDFVFILNNQQSNGKTSDQIGNITLISDFTGIVRINKLNGNLIQTGDITAGSSKTFYSLPAEILVISIYSNNHKIWASKVSVVTNSTITIKAEATTGTLILNTSVSGNLFIDEILRQYVTPGNIVINDLTIGKHSAKIVTSGQTMWQADFNISAGQTTYLNSQAQTNTKFSEPDMILVNGGTFQMGSNDGDEDEKPIMTVTMKNFYISKYEITNKQYCEFLNDYGSNKVKNGQFAGEIMIYPDKYGVQQIIEKWYPASGYEEHPVVGVTWYGANEYCNWLSQKTGKKYRLPYESEWEYAAGGGNQIRTKLAGTNDEKKLTEYCWFDKNAHISFWVDPHANVTGTQKVGTKKPNSLGIYDMSGNVWEWCNDNYTPSYLNLFNNNSQNTNIQKVVRGGSWVNNYISCRVTERTSYFPYYQSNYIGFRVCMSD